MEGERNLLLHRLGLQEKKSGGGKNITKIMP